METTLRHFERGTKILIVVASWRRVNRNIINMLLEAIISIINIHNNIIHFSTISGNPKLPMTRIGARTAVKSNRRYSARFRSTPSRGSE